MNWPPFWTKANKFTCTWDSLSPIYPTSVVGLADPDREIILRRWRKVITRLILGGCKIFYCTAAVKSRRLLRISGKSYLTSRPCQRNVKSNFWWTTTIEWKVMIEVQKMSMNISRKIWIISGPMIWYFNIFVFDCCRKNYAKKVILNLTLVRICKKRKKGCNLY